MPYTIVILRRAQKELTELPSEVYTRVRDALRKLGEDPRPPGYIPAYPVCCQSCYRVSPLATVECLVGRCQGMCRNSHERVECGHWIETPVEAEHKFVEVCL